MHPLWLIINNEINKVSSVSTKEYIQITATFEYLINKKFGCKEKKFKTEKEKQGFQLRNGCNNLISKSPRHTIDQINFHSCVCDHMHINFSDLMFLHENYSKGLLPFNGSLMEQPNHVIEILRILDRLTKEFEQKMIEKSKKDNKK